jgi:putative transposase
MHQNLSPRTVNKYLAAAQAFFRKALATNSPRWPRKVTLDGHTPSHRALRLLRREDPMWKYVRERSCRYLNNIVEQDHRAIKRRCAWMTGFKSFRNAANTLAGIELAHRIRKRQFSFGLGRQRRAWSFEAALGPGFGLESHNPHLAESLVRAAANAPEPRSDGDPETLF